MFGEPLTVYRGSTDKYGNPNKVANGTINGTFGWGKNTRRETKGDAADQTADLYVERGTDLRARDRIKRADGSEWAVVGRATWDQAFPFDGYDFGYVVFQVEAM